MLEKLQKAIRERKVELVESLLAAGVPVNELFGDGKLPLAYAVSYQSPAIVRTLLGARAEVNGRNAPNQDTALIIAAHRGYAEITNILLKAGADPNLANSMGFTPLQEAATDRTAEHLEVIRALIGAGANVNAGGFVSVLMTACRSGSPAMVEVLIAAGADVNAVKPRGTPLTAAVEVNRLENVAVLITHRADTTIRAPAESKHGNLTPLELSKKLKHKKIVALLDDTSGTTPRLGLPAEPPSVDVIWREEIAAIVAEHHPEVDFSLCKCAEREELEKLEQSLGLSLPSDFKHSYMRHDGQKEGAEPLVPPNAYDTYGYQLMPLHDLAAEWNRWKKLTDMGEFRGLKSGPDRGVRDDWWNPAWIPFADNRHGDLLCLDMAPAAGGAFGQVISMNHADTKRERLAASFSAWLADLADYLKNYESRTS